MLKSRKDLPISFTLAKLQTPEKIYKFQMLKRSIISNAGRYSMDSCSEFCPVMLQSDG